MIQPNGCPKESHKATGGGGRNITDLKAGQSANRSRSIREGPKHLLS
jgi:hypothetical protein